MTDVIGEDGKTPVQRLRHNARNALGNAHALLGGRTGLTSDEQKALVAEAKAEVQKALDALGEIQHEVETRDFEAHQQAKAAEREAEAAMAEEGGFDAAFQTAFGGEE